MTAFASNTQRLQLRREPSSGYLLIARGGAYDLPLIHFGEYTLERILMEYLGRKKRLNEPLQLVNLTLTIRRPERDEQHTISLTLNPDS